MPTESFKPILDRDLMKNFPEKIRLPTERQHSGRLSTMLQMPLTVVNNHGEGRRRNHFRFLLASCI